MKGRKVCCTITLILLCLLIVNVFLPYASNGRESQSLFDLFTMMDTGSASGAVIIVALFVIVYLFFMILGIVSCIICLCSTGKDYKYALSAIPFSLFTYFLIFFATGNVHLSIGGILGPLLSIASLVLIFVGNAMGNKTNTNNYYNNYTNNTPNIKIKGYDPMTGKPIYATFKGYNTKTGEPIFD